MLIDENTLSIPLWYMAFSFMRRAGYLGSLFGHQMCRGPNTECLEPNTECFGPNTECFGPNIEHFEPNTEMMHSFHL